MNKKVTKTYFLITSMGGGGAERQISYIYSLPEVDKLICIEPGNEYQLPPEKITFISGQLSNGQVFTKIKQIIWSVYKLKKVGLNRETHLVCFLQLPFIIGIICKLIFRCKVTISLRYNPFGFHEIRKERSLPLWVLRWLLNKADYVVPNSISTSIQLQSFLKNKDMIVPIVNGYELDFIASQSEKEVKPFLHLLKNFDCLLNVGRLSVEKGQFHLLRILSELIKSSKLEKTKLLFVGTGPLHDQLVETAHTLGLKVFVYNDEQTVDTGYDVYFLGFQSNPYFFYRNATLFLFPSLYEGLPNALIESFLCSLPAVSADCNSGPREIMFPERIQSSAFAEIEKCPLGYLISPFGLTENVQSPAISTKEQCWVQVIETFLLSKNEDKQELSSACKKIQTRYDIKSILKLWKDFLAK